MQELTLAVPLLWAGWDRLYFPRACLASSFLHASLKLLNKDWTNRPKSPKHLVQSSERGLKSAAGLSVSPWTRVQIPVTISYLCGVKSLPLGRGEENVSSNLELGEYCYVSRVWGDLLASEAEKPQNQKHNPCLWFLLGFPVICWVKTVCLGYCTMQIFIKLYLFKQRNVLFPNEVSEKTAVCRLTQAFNWNCLGNLMKLNGWTMGNSLVTNPKSKAL